MVQIILRVHICLGPALGARIGRDFSSFGKKLLSSQYSFGNDGHFPFCFLLLEVEVGAGSRALTQRTLLCKGEGPFLSPRRVQFHKRIQRRGECCVWEVTLLMIEKL